LVVRCDFSPLGGAAVPVLWDLVSVCEIIKEWLFWWKLFPKNTWDNFWDANR